MKRKATWISIISAILAIILGGCAHEIPTERGAMSIYDHELKHCLEGRDHPEIGTYGTHWWTDINLAEPKPVIKWVHLTDSRATNLLLSSNTEARVIRHNGEPVCTVLSRYSEQQAKELRD